MWLTPPEFEEHLNDLYSTKVSRTLFLLLKLKNRLRREAIGFSLNPALILEIPVSQPYNISFKYIIL
jgi:hypothetical protein